MQLALPFLLTPFLMASRIDVDAEFKLTGPPTDPNTVNRIRAYLISIEKYQVPPK